MSESHTDLAIRQTVASGGAAGDITVTGIKPEDVLKSVVNLTDGTDLTDEFTITDDDTINNGGGTATTGDTLLVLYIKADPAGHDLNRN